MECNSKWNVNRNGMSLKIEYNEKKKGRTKEKVAQNGMSFK